ncbi:DUF3077 domain-containing protein [Pseudomonas sp. TH32]|uniref:DUF6124 family protein n=1 Tax=Pseudomonas sp. TH32 TaxID=2796397 RepID=UPI0019149797|nr:DUF3077 domain-containing protein [Pseudomonas sp. TH32]MBK5437242.1 DUF3077 domain-containing protein [Pseudomonas sp. TH32]
MDKIVPDPPRSTRDREAFDRALSHYVKPDPLSHPIFTVHHDVSFEDAIAQLSELLRCAAATAGGSAQNATGESRDMAHSTVHLIEMARTLADQALDCLKPH